jgi:hypothetical protein
MHLREKNVIECAGVLLGMGVVGSLLAIGQSLRHDIPFDRDTAIGLTKIFMGLAFVGIAFMLLYVYVLR